MTYIGFINFRSDKCYPYMLTKNMNVSRESLSAEPDKPFILITLNQANLGKMKTISTFIVILQ